MNVRNDSADNGAIRCLLNPPHPKPNLQRRLNCGSTTESHPSPQFSGFRRSCMLLGRENGPLGTALAVDSNRHGLPCVANVMRKDGTYKRWTKLSRTYWTSIGNVGAHTVKTDLHKAGRLMASSPPSSRQMLPKSGHETGGPLEGKAGGFCGYVQAFERTSRAFTR
jgi:hypothetical protein